MTANGDKGKGAGEGRQGRRASEQGENKRCSVLHVEVAHDARSTGRDPGACLDELRRLAASAFDVVWRETLLVRRPSAATLLGKGQVERLGTLVREKNLAVICLDAPLGVLQQRNLERALECSVIDRTTLILKIFAANAKSLEGRLQVARAQCAWQKSRLAKAWQHLERQRGGRGFLAGPGERQIELDRRALETSERRLVKKLKGLHGRRALQRRARRGCHIVALTGYTNSGKSTLFNRLLALPQGERQAVRQQPFLTLDTKIARWRNAPAPNGSDAKSDGKSDSKAATLLLADTVGFIADLPPFLIEAFNATLEEVVQADTVLHVRDIAAEDSAQQKFEVLRVLRDLGCKGRILEVWNKIDRLPPSEQQTAMVAARACDAVPLSALTGEGCDGLQRLVVAAASSA